VQLVVSDAHTGLKQAIGPVLLGACWQRSSANLIGGGRFPPPPLGEDLGSVTDQVQRQIRPSRRRPSSIGQWESCLEHLEHPDAAIFASFPGVGPTPTGVLLAEIGEGRPVPHPGRAACRVWACPRHHDECQTGDRRYLSEATMAPLTTSRQQKGAAPELMTA
jgi:hypothetical protein